MTKAITVMGETFEQVVGKTIGPEYKSCGNTFWPDEMFVEIAREFHSHPIHEDEMLKEHFHTAADYEFQSQKGFVLGPPQAGQAGNRQEMIKKGCVGVYFREPKLSA